MCRGNERVGFPIRVCQLRGHERGEVPFDGLEVDSEVPGKAFVSEFTKPAQEALSIFLRRRKELDLHRSISKTSLTVLAPSRIVCLLVTSARLPIGELLVAAGLITQDVLNGALRDQAADGRRL